MRETEGVLAGLGPVDDGRDGHRLLADAGLTLVVERPLERADVEVDTLHRSVIVCGQADPPPF
jgi:hypothetical protein